MDGEGLACWRKRELENVSLRTLVREHLNVTNSRLLQQARSTNISILPHHTALHGNALFSRK